MKNFSIIIFLILAFVFISSLSSQAFAQNGDIGLSGGLETNHQNYFYKDPNKAFLQAFFPGLLIHGYGHFYADDQLTGDVLLTGEVVSLLSVGCGILIESNTTTFSGGILGDSNNAGTIGTNMIWGGIAAFTLLWVVDMAHAPTAASDYDAQHDLKPIAYMEQNSPVLALACRF
jgi:hypothetical protein